MRSWLIYALLLTFTLGCSPTVEDPEPQVDPERHDQIKYPNRPPDVAPITSTGELDQQNLPALIQTLGHADFDRRQQAVDLLLAAEDPGVVDHLLLALEDDNYHVRAGVVYALGCFGERAVVAVEKLEQVQHEDARESVRDAAAFAIDAIQHP